MNIKKKNKKTFFWGGSGWGGGGGAGGWVRVDVNGELKFLLILKKKMGGAGGWSGLM